MKVTLDITSFLSALRSQNGFLASEFEKYAKYTASIMPNLRRQAAPALRVQSAKHPFVFTEENLKKEDLGLAIVDQPLIKLIIAEAERAYCKSVKLQKFMQSGEEKLSKLNFQSLRRRQILNLKRAVERANTLFETSKRFGSQTFQIQSEYYKIFMESLLQQEQDQYFEALNGFSQVISLLKLLEDEQVEQEGVQYCTNDATQRLNHCMFMAKAFAGDDEQIIKQIELDASEKAKECKAKYQKIKNEQVEQMEVLKIFDSKNNREIDLVIPKGAINHKLVNIKGADILKANINPQIKEIQDYFDKHQYQGQIYIPGVFGRPAQAKSDQMHAQFKMFTAKLVRVQNLFNQCNSYLDKPHPIDPSRLQHLSIFLKQELTHLKTIYSKLAIKNYLLGFSHGGFCKKLNVQKACEFVLCQQLNVKALNERSIAQIQGDETLIAYYVNKLEKLIKAPEKFAILELQKPVEFKIDVTYEVMNGKLVEKKVDAMKQQQLYNAQLEKVLQQMLYVCQKPCDALEKLQAKKCIESALAIMQQRKDFKMPEFGSAKLAPVLPNPVMFNVVVEELVFDDFMFDCEKEKKQGILKGLFK